MKLDHFAFPSQQTDAPDGFAGYQHLYSNGTDVDRGPGPFRAEVTVGTFRNLVVFERHLAGVRHTRAPARVRRDGFEHINMQLLLDGSLFGGPLGDERRVQPGEIIFFDMTRPQRSFTEGARMIALSLRRDLLEQHGPLPSALHGTILPANTGALLGDLMQSLIRQAPTLPPHASDYASQAVAALVAGALGGTLGGTLGSGAPDQKLGADHAARFRFERITHFIGQHLSDPGLDAGKAADALGLSRSTVNRCMSDAGGFSATLQDMRLDRMRSLLRQVSSDRTVGAIAHDVGFSSVSHATRSFRARFGLPPRQWREDHAGHRRTQRDAPGTLDYLFKELT